MTTPLHLPALSVVAAAAVAAWPGATFWVGWNIIITSETGPRGARAAATFVAHDNDARDANDCDTQMKLKPEQELDQEWE